jgi:hypothetical protein
MDRPGVPRTASAARNLEAPVVGFEGSGHHKPARAASPWSKWSDLDMEGGGASATATQESSGIIWTRSEIYPNR